MTSQPVHHQLDIGLNTVPPVMKRGEHVLLFLIDENGQFVLARKDIYPEGIYRMLGGGIDQGETPLQAAQRELAEETGIQLPAEQFKMLLTASANLNSPEGQFSFTTHVFAAHVSSAELKPGSDIQGVVHLDTAQYRQLVERYRQLPQETDPNSGFSWVDYGKLYGLLHDSAWQAYLSSQPAAELTE